MGASFESKICPADQLAARLSGLARPLVFTNGVFDILHRGHVTYLDAARALGATLIVGVNTDASVRRLNKGPDRPINREADRAALLSIASVLTDQDVDDIITAFQKVGHALAAEGR